VVLVLVDDLGLLGAYVCGSQTEGREPESLEKQPLQLHGKHSLVNELFWAANLELVKPRNPSQACTPGKRVHAHCGGTFQHDCIRGAVCVDDCKRSVLPLGRVEA